MTYTQQWTNEKCDKYDYLIAAFSGVVSGFIDVFFVDAPGQSVLGDWTDTKTDNLVKKFAKLSGWSPREGNENSIASAIGFLEKKFKVNYDQANTTQVSGVFKMGTTNHHYKSLAHSPDIVGLFFSILDQFQHKSSFLSDGKLIRIETTNQDFALYGDNLTAKLYCGFCNWVGHIMSDIAGSSGGRGNTTGRGSGVPIPFMQLFQLCNFGELKIKSNRQTLATVMTEVFQKGYDVRFGAALAIPVLINELIIRTFWVIKKHFYEKKSWKESIPTKQNANFRTMLLVGYSSLCVIDSTDAAIQSHGNILVFILHLNLIAWVRFIILIFRELHIRYGEKVLSALKAFLREISGSLTPNEQRLVDEYYARMQQFDANLDQILGEYIEIVNQENLLFQTELKAAFNESSSFKDRSDHSVRLAKISNVDMQEVIISKNDLNNFFLD